MPSPTQGGLNYEKYDQKSPKMTYFCIFYYENDRKNSEKSYSDSKFFKEFKNNKIMISNWSLTA